MADEESDIIESALGRTPPAIGEGIDVMRLPLSQAGHLPGYIYTSPEIYQLEKEKIFMKDWLCVARAEKLEKPGDFMTHDVMGDPIVIARDEDGELNAFSNLCRHRGVEVAEGAGNAREFMCPYHNWLYDLKGRLIGAPFMKKSEGFEPKNCRLHPLLVDTWAGWVFVNFDTRAGPLADFVAPFEKRFAFLKQETLRVAERLVYEIECNWKFVAENLVDLYHVCIVHKDTFGKFLKAEEMPVQLEADGGNTIIYEGAPHTFDGKPLFGKMPQLADQPDSFAATGYLSPNFHLFARIENMRPCVHWPLSPTRTRLVYYNLFPAEWFDRPDFTEKVAQYRRYYDQVVNEDSAMIESLQRAQSSVKYEPGRMSTLEKGLHNLVNNHIERIFGGG